MSQPAVPTTDSVELNNLDEIETSLLSSSFESQFRRKKHQSTPPNPSPDIEHHLARIGFRHSSPAKMCETVVVHHRCGHEETTKTSVCYKEPKSFFDMNGERVAGLKGLPAPLPWCSFQSKPLVRSIRLCPDCRKQRRKEARESKPNCEDWQEAWRWWKDWTSSEDEGEREKRKRDEAERLEKAERRLSEMVDGW
ncbi:hypothetical protein L207DRAFT_525762 [Hyaloscypha variabilis F]|uniref:Uncharacterized protein n=1 Tax=Hyaloscypha variabilis (strain UAMH 11265 / GT02V1 / F) TaxID=1149755 RepID=A0A2J6S0W7_HYAVF|nr:hypothetical protein L207DRAFT_525762 [Hyaloscypha variabilis F]